MQAAVVAATLLFALGLAWSTLLVPVWVLLAITVTVVCVIWVLADNFRSVAVIYVAAALFSPSLFRDLSFVSSGLRLDHFLLAGVAFLLGLRILMTGRMRRINPAVVLFSLFIVSSLTSVFLNTGVNPNNSLTGDLIALQGLARPLVVLLVFSLILRTEKQVRHIVWAVMLGGTVMSVFAVLQFSGIDAVVDFTVQYFDRKETPIVLGDRGAVVGTFDGLHNSLGLFFVLFISLCMALIWNTGAALSNRARGFVVVAILIAFVGLLGTFSRTGFVAMLVAVGTIVFLQYRSFVGKRLLYLAAFIGVVAATAFASALYSDYVRVRFLGQLLSLDFTIADPRYQVAAPKLMDLFMANPLFGAGVNLGTAGDIGFLVRLAAGGMVGFLLFFVTIAYVIYSARQVIRLSPPGIYKSVAVAVLATTMGLLVASLAATPFWTARLMEVYWLLVACLLFAKREVLRARSDSGTPGEVPMANSHSHLQQPPRRTELSE